MSVEQDLTELRNDLKQWREEDLRTAERHRHEDLSYILGAFCLGTLSLALSNPHVVNWVVTVVFGLAAAGVLGRSCKYKAKRQ